MIEDGKSTRIPDSLTNVFHTAAGREVRDGGGIRPDIEPKGEELSTLIYYLMQDMVIFDFANEFCLKNSSIEPAATFDISDETYDEFKEFIKAKNFSYDLMSVKALDDLKKLTELEGFKDIVKDEIESLEKKLQSNLDHSLEHFSKDIKILIADEIVRRYYSEKGGIIYSLREDMDIQESYKVLEDNDRYREILSPKK